VVVRTVGDDVLELAQAALLAFVEGDREGLERVLAPSLVRVSPVFGKTRRSRSAVLAIALNPSRRSGATPGVPLDRLVLLDDLRAATLADLGETALPPGVSPSD